MLGEIQMERDESEAGVATGEIYNNANRIFLLQFKKFGGFISFYLYQYPTVIGCRFF